MAGLPWFKMWKTFATDIKVQEMSFDEQRHWVMLLCLRCDEDYEATPINTDRKVSVFLRIGKKEVVSLKAILTLKGMIDENWNPTNWDIYQAKGYLSKERTAEMRRKKKEHVTSQSRHSVVTCDENLSQISNLTSVRGNGINTGETIGDRVEY